MIDSEGRPRSHAAACLLLSAQAPAERGCNLFSGQVIKQCGIVRQGETTVPVIHTSRIRIEKHEGPHRTAHIEGFVEPVHFGIHGGIRHFYQNKYGRELSGPEYPATLDHIVAGVAG